MTAPDAPLPPSDVGAERALLGACMISGPALDDAAEQVRPDDFYRPAHGELFAAMLAIRDAGREVDPVTLAAHVGAGLARLGGEPYLVDLYGGVATASNSAYYAEIVTEKAVRRRLVEAGQRAMQLGYHVDGEAAEVVERARAALDLVAEQARGDTGQTAEIDDLAEQALHRYASDAPPSLATGWVDLDGLIGGGLRPGTVTVVGARPGTGKSIIGGCCATQVALRGHGALIVSLEMTQAELTDRIISNLASVDLDSLMQHKLTDRDWSAVESAARRLQGIPLAIDDRPDLSLTGIRSLARDRARTPRGLSLLVVDYLGLIRPADPKIERVHQVSVLSRGMKMLAKELAVPILALHQLNRQSEMRASRRPQLSDLRDSGAVEQDADAVWLLHRDDTDEEHRFDLELQVAKNRNGRTGTVHLQWSPQYARAGSTAYLGVA